MQLVFRHDTSVMSLEAGLASGDCVRCCSVFMVGAILVTALALFIDWLARIVEMVAAPKGL